jgi:hypothetical protein
MLHELGIKDPADIDLEAIAWTQGARVRYRPLRGCEARIFGHGENAVISINIGSSFTRKRFSLAHELGHWHFHRGKLLFCRASDIGGMRGHSDHERVANRFAADLLMPAFMFDPLIRALPKVDFGTLDGVANTFSVSRTAAAIRMVERNYCPAVLVCHEKRGRKWFVRAPDVPEKWFPRADLDPESYAFDVLFGGKPEDRLSHKIGADAWFDRWEAEKYEVREQTVRTHGGETLTLITIIDSKMLD